MTTHTSRLAYLNINTDGTSDTQKKTILSLVRKNHKINSRDLSLREISRMTGYDINAVSGRVNDLKKDGLLETTTKRKCSITQKLISPIIPSNIEGI